MARTAGEWMAEQKSRRAAHNPEDYFPGTFDLSPSEMLGECVKELRRERQLARWLVSRERDEALTMLERAWERASEEELGAQ